MKPEAQIRTGLITAIFLLACLALEIIYELYDGSLLAVLIDIIMIYIFIVYLQGVLKKDIQIAKRAYRTYFVIWFFFFAFLLICLPFWVSDKDKRIGTAALLLCLGSYTLTLFFLKMGINGLMQHPETKNKSEKVKLLWLAILPFIIVVLIMIGFIFSPLFGFIFSPL
ncbi:MAG: hypothetical protein ABSE89_01935 [Sedimentisphaerales bacterium]